jgi:hypothetical protein
VVPSLSGRKTFGRDWFAWLRGADPLAQSDVEAWRLEEFKTMAREKITNGPNERAIDENIAGTGPGIPDDALTPGGELIDPPTEEEVRRIAEKLGAPLPETSR